MTEWRLDVWRRLPIHFHALIGDIHDPQFGNSKFGVKTGFFAAVIGQGRDSYLNHQVGPSGQRLFARIVGYGYQREVWFRLRIFAKIEWALRGYDVGRPKT